jgi:large subunit ribosomal protein L21
MYAIVEIAGQQFKIQKGRSIYTHRLEGDVDAALASDKVKVLLVDNEGSISIGAPTVAGATISAKIVEQEKASERLQKEKWPPSIPDESPNRRYNSINVFSLRLADAPGFTHQPTIN